MNLETVEEGDDILKLKLTDSNEAVANSLRRAMVSKVPTLAIEELYITKNQSGLFDEVIANRMGQIPFTIPQNVDEDDEVNIAVKKEGPATVKAEDIQAGNDEAEPVNPEAIIVELKEDQDIELEGIATLGYGKEHAKHQGGTVGYEKIGDGDFLFRIESTSGYTNEELFQKAVEVLEDELDDFEESL